VNGICTVEMVTDAGPPQDAACAAGDNLCGNVCVDLTSDPGNCGVCNHACAAGDVCVNAVCTVGAQDGGAADVISSCGPVNCSGCCDANGTCQAGETNQACGLGGGACGICSNPKACTNGACL
jgi:hypothetical protein